MLKSEYPPPLRICSPSTSLKTEYLQKYAYVAYFFPVMKKKSINDKIVLSLALKKKYIYKKITPPVALKNVFEI